MKEIVPGTFILGTFKMLSGRAVISDPCYDKIESTPAGRRINWDMENIQTGTWEASVIKEAGRIMVLHAVYRKIIFSGLGKKMKFKQVPVTIGVDSGQAGIFDAKHYRDDLVVEPKMICDIYPEEPWYSMCCKKTNSKNNAGIVPFGCVSGSGHGDGEYILETAEINGKTVGIQILFI